MDDSCHVCDGVRPAMDTCRACFGRGKVDWIGLCARPWDEVMPGLWVGCHDFVADAGVESAVVSDEFDVVISLYALDGHGPMDHVEHHQHRMADVSEALDAVDAERVAELAKLTADRVRAGRKVLVRCQAGLNRSSLVAAMAMVRLGWEPAAAITAIREARDQNCLFNRAFTAHVLASA